MIAVGSLFDGINVIYTAKTMTEVKQAIIA